MIGVNIPSCHCSTTSRWSFYIFSLPVSFTAVTIFSELMAYPIDTVRRRMMMTSGEKVKYRGAFHCAGHIVKKEGAMALMRGAGQSEALRNSCLFLFVRRNAIAFRTIEIG